MSLYVLTRLIRPVVDSEFIKYHLTDLFFIPVLLSASVLLTKIIKRDNKLLYLKPLDIGIVIFFVSIYFEWYLPNFNNPNQYTSDYIDIIMYFVGGLIFWFIQKTKN